MLDTAEFCLEFPRYDTRSDPHHGEIFSPLPQSRLSAGPRMASCMIHRLPNHELWRMASTSWRDSLPKRSASPFLTIPEESGACLRLIAAMNRRDVNVFGVVRIRLAQPDSHLFCLRVYLAHQWHLCTLLLIVRLIQADCVDLSSGTNLLGRSLALQCGGPSPLSTLPEPLLGFKPKFFPLSVLPFRVFEVHRTAP